MRDDLSALLLEEPRLFEHIRVVSWFSCGTASAVNTKLILAEYGDTCDVNVVRCIVPEEHPDNDRFAADCERWYGVPIMKLRSKEYESCEDVWARTRYMSGIGGARCTVEMKKVPRWSFEDDWMPDWQGYGYTADEQSRIDNFRANNPEVMLRSLIAERGLSKPDCHAIVQRAGIELPMMYRLGFNNANCIGCVNAQSPTYWKRTRRHFPDVFERRARLSRELGVRLVKGTTGPRERYFLDELDAAPDDGQDEPNIECSLLCAIAEKVIAA